MCGIACLEILLAKYNVVGVTFASHATGPTDQQLSICLELILLLSF